MLVLLLLFSGCDELEVSKYEAQELLQNYPEGELPLPDNAFIFEQEESKGEIIVWYGMEEKDMNDTRAFYVNYLNSNEIYATEEQDSNEDLISGCVGMYDFDIRIQKPNSEQEKLFQSVVKVKIKMYGQNPADAQLNNDTTQETAQPVMNTDAAATNETTAAPTAASTLAPEESTFTLQVKPTPERTDNLDEGGFNLDGRAMSQEGFVAILESKVWEYVDTIDGPSEFPALGYKDIALDDGVQYYLDFKDSYATYHWTRMGNQQVVRDEKHQYGLDGTKAMVWNDELNLEDGNKYYAYYYYYITVEGYLVESAKLWNVDTGEPYNVSTWNIYKQKD